MSYDSNFDAQRLSQLADQYLASNSAKGRVFFQSYSDDNRLDHARWQLDDTVYTNLNASGFKQLLMELLDNLMVYRAEHFQVNSDRGVVHIHGNKLAIEWLSAHQFDMNADECEQ